VKRICSSSKIIISNAYLTRKRKKKGWQERGKGENGAGDGEKSAKQGGNLVVINRD